MAAAERRFLPREDLAFDIGEVPRRRVRVLLPLPLAGAYDYLAAEGLDVPPGTFVEVPLGRRHLIGVVWDDAAGDAKPVEEAKLKAIAARLDLPPLRAELRRFVDWIAAYSLSPPGAVLRMAMSVPEAFLPARARVGLAASTTAPDPQAPDVALPDSDRKRLTPARRRVLDALAQRSPRVQGELARAAGVSTAVVRAMAELGWLSEAALPEPVPVEPDGAQRGPALSPDQRAAADALVAKVGTGFSVTLLDGVTGSGKTEVYFEAIAAAINAGKQVLVLLPEIALSAQWLERFAARFGAPPAVWHSQVRRNLRPRTWRDVAAGHARVVVGARSALFLPFSDLGLIVVDEEHDPAYKQEDGVIYHARDMAVVRARLTGMPVVLVSATPSLETIVNVEHGRYAAVHLTDRHGGAQLPVVRAIDLRRDPPPRVAGRGMAFLSPTLRQALTDTLAAGGQSLLFLNRRGYAPLTLCRSCGHRLQCPSCTAWLVEHRLARRLQCHHCGYSAPLPKTCPQCGSEDNFAACGPGVERIAEEVAALLPEARLALATSDTVPGPEEADAFVRKMEAREIDIVIGTQIVAKGNHFPHLTLVGVVDADLGLAGGDLRAAERTFQVLQQVAGRAGRAERPGRVLLQTYVPEHPVIQALIAGDRDRFLTVESADRRRFGWPPYGRLAAVIVSGREEQEVDRVARRLGQTAPRAAGVKVLGPAPAPLSILRGRHRRRLLVKAERGVVVQDVLSAWIGALDAPSTVRIQVDVDPYSFL
jgi:primosomal protein N' (replication factor Y) (superfamily II helicase)